MHLHQNRYKIKYRGEKKEENPEEEEKDFFKLPNISRNYRETHI